MNVYYHSISNLDCINNGCQSRLLGPCIVLLLLLRLVSLRCPRLSKWQHVPARPLPGSVARSSRSRPHPSVRPRIPTRCALCSSALLPGHDSRTGVGFRAPRCVRPRAPVCRHPRPIRSAHPSAGRQRLDPRRSNRVNPRSQGRRTRAPATETKAGSPVPSFSLAREPTAEV